MALNYTEHLRVDPQIVSLLSKSTYQKSFPSAIRELVSNAYDADALSVNIDLDKTVSIIEVTDDGNGMTFEEFKRYLKIAGKKQEGQLTRKYKRKRIGNFGVGFLSVFPFCDSLQIVTTTENSSDLLTATIPTKEFFINDKPSKKKALEINVEDIPINIVIRPNPKEKLLHYTKIRLINPTWLVDQYFTKAKENRKDSVIFWEPIDRFIWELQEDLPISLKETSKYYSSSKYDEPIGISVKVNGKELYRNDYLDFVVSQGEKVIQGITCKYIFTSNYKIISLLQARAVKLRVNNVGVGRRTDFDLRRDRGFSRLSWVAGEVFFSEEMKSNLNISRDDFVINSSTEEIFDFLADKLRQAATEIDLVALSEQNFDNKVRLPANKSRKEVLESDIKKLENRGFEIIYNKNDNPTLIDKSDKKVYVSKFDIDEKETIDILNKTYEIKYERLNNNSACRKLDNNTIAINQDYPLFKSKSLGDIFKRIHILLLLGEEKEQSSPKLADFLRTNFLKEFGDI